MPRPWLLVLLTRVRPIATGEHRDERHCPERIIEAVGAVDRGGFSPRCARCRRWRFGRQRAKVVDLAGQDGWERTESGSHQAARRSWTAPLVTEASGEALRRLGMRRSGSWE